MNSLIYVGLALVLLGLGRIGRRVELYPRGSVPDEEGRQRSEATIRRGARACDAVAACFLLVAVVILF